MWNILLKALFISVMFSLFSNKLVAIEAEGAEATETDSPEAIETKTEVKEVEKTKDAEQKFVYMFSDIQGRHVALKDVLISYNIVDNEFNWLSANNDLVLIGNLIGDKSSAFDTLKMIRNIQQSAEQANAQLKIVLGEKDIDFVLSEFSRYPASPELKPELGPEVESKVESKVEQEIDPEAGAEAELEKKPNEKAEDKLKNHSELISWLSEQDFITQMNGHLFVNGGISSRTKKKSLVEINQTLKRSFDEYKNRWQAIVEKDSALNDAAFNNRYSVVRTLPDSAEKQAFLKTQRSYIFSHFWPMNYTGNSFCHPLFERQNLDEALHGWQVNKVWSARAEYRVPGFQDRFQGMMTFVDQDKASTNSAEILGAKIEEGGAYKLLQGKNEFTDAPKSIASRKYQLPYDMTPDEIKAFLKAAKVVSKEQTKEGKTKPLKIYLEKEDKRIKAIFKYINASGRGNRKGVPRTGDKYDYESAAYKLDGMLGIGLVPITVERVVNNKRGVVQLWIDGLVSAVPLNTGEETYTGMCDAQQQENMINTFDFLIMNTDRNQTNITFTKKDWQIWFIDHTRSFGNDTKAPRFLRGVRIEPTNLFKEKLSKISRAQLNELSLWLSERQLDAMWQRRNRLVELDYILD